MPSILATLRMGASRPSLRTRQAGDRFPFLDKAAPQIMTVPNLILFLL